MIKNVLPQQLCNVLGYVCVEVSHSSGRDYYAFVATTSLWITGILLFLHTTHLSVLIQETFLTFLELCFCGFWIFLYSTAMVWTLIFGSGMAAFFAFYSILIYGSYGWLKFSPYLSRVQNADEIIVT